MTLTLAVRRSGILAVALVANAMVFLLAGLLAEQHGAPQDITEPVGVSLVSLQPPEPPQQEEVQEPEPPTPQPERPDFAPALVQPAVTGPALDGLAVQIDLAGQEMGGARDDFIFDSADLDRAPQTIARVQPDYPYRAREMGIEGYVAVKFMVREDGSVGNINILKAQPQGRFEEVVRRSLVRWRFQPGQIGGQNVASWVVTTIRFNLN